MDRALEAWLSTLETVRRNRFALSGWSLAVIFVVSVAYLTFGALRINPARSTIEVRVPLTESGGLLPQQDVTVRGVPVGRVKSVVLADGGVTAVASIDARTNIPVDSTVRVSGLSAAGEQYLDFRPATDRGPYLTDGSVVDPDRTSVPVTLAQALANANGALAQVDPEKLAVIRRELGVSVKGPEKLADILDGGTFLISALDGVLPETVSLLSTSRVVFDTMVDVDPGLAATGQSLGSLFAGMARMDSGFRTLVARAPDNLEGIDNLFADNSETMVRLLGNLATVAELSYVRVPALNALFPDPAVRGSVLENLLTVFHDGAVWGIGDMYPRYACDYQVPRQPPSAADYPEPRRYTYCNDPDPSVLIRGARNAPRPAGDDTAGPPPGADLNATTDPTPRGRWTIPTPYGGPPLPMAVPGENADRPGS
ncbi:MlaD family protein [Mycolicibacterium holsaticum]|uniref:MlaD family protein n=1 Tax=Mycolicibacterium holsaticum TaxID=152142 RepID=UPI001C7D2744|nr:MlaD family protein [Mycolicibacterium holsaticum]MDA4109351.1 mammalian cell entry protein [Mycolicibacterium holsaticum DSM 44478 = JCM 12374]QZA11735.1 MlaD family protein [Mycolicibacterium holsaticum DSM 44478 = JCM 12374]UNC10778.1 MCE family protein [Mycolicibacterium holsaticum DSM 44478 = JCM 12374]